MTSSTTGLCLQGGVKTNGGQPGRLSCAAVDNGFQESDTWTQQVLRPASIASTSRPKPAPTLRSPVRMRGRFMSISVPVAAGKAGTTGEVLNRVNALVPVLHSRAAATEKLRRMHPENLRDLTDASQTLLTAD